MNMFSTLKDLDKLFFGLVICLILCINNFTSTVAIETQGNELLLRGDRKSSDLKLRGEIWYGNASWYGSKFQGRKTSNGEKFNKNKLTAAHRSLPFNTKVLVTNLKNNKTVIVRINDRGPFNHNRIIDLSEEAAEKLDLKKQGIAYVKVQILTPTIDNEADSQKEEKQS